MKLLNFNIIKLSICLIIGICIGFYFEISIKNSLYALLILIFGLTVAYIYSSKKNKLTHLFGGLVVSIFVLLGILRTQLYDETIQPSHYINSKIDYSNYQDFQLKIIERLKPDNYNLKYIAEIISLNDIKASGKVLLNLQKDSTLYDLGIGEFYFTNSQLSQVSGPKNPFQFDYRNYLKKRNIHHQIYLDSNELIKLEGHSTSIATYADAFRTQVNFKLEKAGFKPDTLAIINALLLGQRQDISPEIYNNYVNAGTIHILAVSGLHVGIIFIILTYLLRPLHRLKYGKHILKPILILLVLWSFAFIAGLSPSVTRAVTMFSIITFAQFLRRPTNIYNTITISAFILLFLKPIYLFDVGFQMSYLAVLAIVSIQPMLYKLWTPNYKVVDYFWQIFTVTIAAQLGVAPISLFYFHQFPGLFFVSNLVIIPVLGVILGVGILVILLALIDILPSILAKGFGFIIESLNNFIAWIAQFENFLLRDISFSIYHVLASYLMIISGLYLFKQKSVKSIHYSLFSVLLFSCVLIYTKHKNSTNELVIYNKTRATILGKKADHQLVVYHNLDSNTIQHEKTLKNYEVGHFINSTIYDRLELVYSFKNEKILLVDSLGVYNTKNFKADYILLKDSPKINLNRLIDSLQPKQIIADASNYKSYVERWKQTCRDKKIPFHSTYEKGAFIFK
ncbi:ComEC/Rec2 family competence protein [Winogradskyella jejuensis]|uniref:Competence protein ComEC n=1 Tax=Winogradskyella jejuensis TaxID=1089305 RepID=A0A1M5LEF6_9FLAO|nr:ComEC/Rec2 family competence protein [Winogradskyella jejuensis]SHG63346.1 competence protein ComEC [Winogradskyella jejuensis]